MNTTLDRPYIIEMPRFCDPRGNLSFVQDDDQVPFAIRHVSWMYDLPADSAVSLSTIDDRLRVILPLAGSFDVKVTTTDKVTSSHHLNRAYMALFIPSRAEVALTNTSSNSVALILSSTLDPADDD